MREFEIERQFGIKIENIRPNKGVYYLKTNKGDKCLKKINYGAQKLLFVYGAKEHLINNGFKYVDKYCLNLNGEPYAIINEDIYTLSEWIDGRECDYKNKEDLSKAAAFLCKMHKASCGYEPPENSKLKTDLGRWPHLMQKRVRALDKMRGMVRKKNRKTQFDLTYIENVEFYKKLGKKAIELMDKSIYIELCDKAEEEKSFCHHDYNYHNIIIDKNDNVNIIDFDYCKKEIRAYDVANFITKTVKRLDWNIEYAKLIIDEYNKVNPLTEEELQVVYIFLVFPQRFWRLCNRYYYNEVTWGESTFDRKINNLIGEQDKFKEFLEKFKKEYNLNE